MPQIIPLFPKNINTFVDLFGGGFNVGVNVDAKHIIYNDIEHHVVELFTYTKEHNVDDMLNEIDTYITQHGLSKTNREGFLALRNDYNSGVNTPIMFYTLLSYAFNYQIRFNSKGEYNMPFGKERSSFSPTLRAKFISFCERLHSIDCSFENRPFTDFGYFHLNSGDFVYCDPPYFNSVATYNENNGWGEQDEQDLLDFLDMLNAGGFRFALSNNLKYDNPLLAEWRKKYHTHYLNGDYSNCNYHKKDRTKDVEVLITNY